MRSLYNPGSVLKAIVSPIAGVLGLGDKKEVKAPVTTTATEDKAKADEAARQAAEAQRKEAGARTGSSSTLLSPQTDVSLLSTRRRTLGSS